MTDVRREAVAATCAWCGVALVAEDGRWTGPDGTGDYCPEGLAVGDTGTSPHLPAPSPADLSLAELYVHAACHGTPHQCEYDEALRDAERTLAARVAAALTPSRDRNFDPSDIFLPPSGQAENIELLRRLDGWDESKSPGPIIRWAAAHLRGCIALSTPSPSEPSPAEGLREDDGIGLEPIEALGSIAKFSGDPGSRWVAEKALARAALTAEPDRPSGYLDALALSPYIAAALRVVNPDATPIGTLESRDRYERWADRLIATALAARLEHDSGGEG